MGAGAHAPRVALVAGATGLVGREIVRLLSQAGTEVRALLRSDYPVGENVAFHVDAAFCALGTTIRKAGSQEAFRRVDYDHPLAVARAARAGGASHFLLVSALGASARSRVFYNRVKGELEDALRGLGYPSLTIARPSILLGERAERRPGEELAKKIGWLAPSRWRPVHATQVAGALVDAARRAKPGIEILENPVLRSFPAS
jgi:uncharacterized protein YbjT (DUF2867 family)